MAVFVEHVYAAFKDWRVSGSIASISPCLTLCTLHDQIYVGGVIYFGLNCALASISAFLPTIIKTFGFSTSPIPPFRHQHEVTRVLWIANALAQLLTVPPYAVAAITICLASYASDRLQSRGLFMAGASGIGGIGYL